jgi:hypothetical protein
MSLFALTIAGLIGAVVLIVGVIVLINKFAD